MGNIREVYRTRYILKVSVGKKKLTQEVFQNGRVEHRTFPSLTKSPIFLQFPIQSPVVSVVLL